MSSSVSVSVAPEWDLLSGRYYRRLTLYSALPWSTSTPAAAAAATSSSSGVVDGATTGRLDLSAHTVAAAPFGGPIAAIRDDSEIVQQVHSEAEPSTSGRRLLLFSSSAHPIASAPWPPLLPRLHSLAFSSSLSLLALLYDGSLIRFRFPDLQPVPSSGSVPLLPPASGGVADALFWGGGVAILTKDNRVVVATNIEVDDPRPRHLADPGIGDEEHVLCIAVVGPQFVLSGSPEVLLAVGDRIVAVDEDAMQVLGADLDIGPVQKMAVSTNGKLFALFTHDGRLLVVPTDFSSIIFEYKCDSALPPEQIAWCGLDSLLLYWPEVLLMVGPSGDPVEYNYDEPIKLIPECDGVRILSNSSMEFLYQVPDSTASIFGIGSMSPAALLCNTHDHYDKQSAKPYDNYQLLLSSLPESIEACIDAAGHEFDVSLQRRLLRAAKYGLGFCSRFPHEDLESMCTILQVLNAVRDPKIGMPLTIQQYKLLTASVLIGRLVNANQHLLALRISEYLNLHSEVMIMIQHWACEKITASANLPDAVLLESLLDKLRLCKGISYSAVAAHADNSGRQGLATMLVDHESRPSKQVDGSEGVQDNNLALVKEEEYPVPEGSKNITPKVMQEIAEKFFKCSICRYVVREPAVISCGHMFCVGCVEMAMSVVGSSVCPTCRKCYNYLPFVCPLIGDLVLKLQSFWADAMETREANEKVIEPISVCECSIQLEDISCVRCQTFLYQPTVLNCGHVFCISCVPFGGDGEIISCPTCGVLHPSGLAICCELNNFIEDHFSAVYKARAEKAKPFSGTPLSRETMDRHTKLSSTHVGVGCDFCGVYPIQGDRFTCKNCVNFDLCEKCAKMEAPIAGRSGQQHSPDHILELNNSFLFSTVLSALDKKEAEQDGQGSWDWNPAGWEVTDGVMRWNPGHQAPEDLDGSEEDDDEFGSAFLDLSD